MLVLYSFDSKVNLVRNLIKRKKTQQTKILRVK